jgi:hypothetical protein
MAFSFPHELYQETIGIVVVTPSGTPRIDLVGLQPFLEGKLHRSKWPQAIIYMDALPKNQVMISLFPPINDYPKRENLYLYE